MRRPQKYIPLSTWLAKVKRFQEAGDPGAIVRVIQEGEDGEEDLTEECSLEEVEAKVPGLYHLVDADGDTVAKVRVGVSGDRMMLPARRSLASEAITRRAASEIAAVGQQWGDLATFQGSLVKEQKAEIDKLKAERDDLARQLLLEQAKNTLEESEESEFMPLLVQGIDLFAGKGIKEKFKQAAVNIISRARSADIVNDEQCSALVLLANEELAQLTAGITLAKPKEEQS